VRVSIAERRAQLVRSRSRQNLLTADDADHTLTSLDVDSETQSPKTPADSRHQRLRRTPGHAGKMSPAALDSLMAST